MLEISIFNGLMEQAIKDSSAKAFAKRLELVVYQAPNVPARAVGDSRRLAQIIHKLLDNAIKFTEKGAIILNVSQESESQQSIVLRFEVRDTGIGLSAAAISRLFGAFQQQDGSDTRSFGGAGLGLAFCRHLVRLMGGQIGVESVEGQGSVFRFSVNLQPSNREGSSGLDASFTLSNAGPVLVVDDNRCQSARLGSISRELALPCYFGCRRQRGGSDLS